MGNVHQLKPQRFRPSRPAMYCAGVQPPAAREATVTFSFPLPPSLLLRVQPGRWQPCLHGVRVDVGSGGDVAIGGFDGAEQYATRQVFDQVVRFLDCIVPRAGADVLPEAIEAELVCQSRADRPLLFHIVLNSRVTIAQRERFYVKPAMGG
jgi:hypothetical protein